MINDRINKLIDTILENHPLFEKGWLYDEYDLEEGITDSYKNYFYIRKNGSKNTRFDTEVGCSAYVVSGNYYMIIGLESCMDSDMVLKNIYLELENQFVEEVTGYNDDSEEVYKEQTEQEMMDECKYLRIDFKVNAHVKLSCAEPLCRDNCCDSQTKKVLNNSL